MAPRGEQDVVADGGVALAVVLAGAAQGDAVVDQAVVADLGGLADDDAHAVVDDQAAADLGAGVDLNAGEVAAPAGRSVRARKLQLVTVTEVRGLVIHGGVHAGIEQEDLQLAPGGRVAGLIGR